MAHPTRKDINIYRIDGSKLATEMGNTKVSNMIILGAYMKARPIVQLENVILGLKKSLPERYHHLIPLNESALTKGMDNLEEVQVL